MNSYAYYGTQFLIDFYFTNEQKKNLYVEDCSIYIEIASVPLTKSTIAASLTQSATAIIIRIIQRSYYVCVAIRVAAQPFICHYELVFLFAFQNWEFPCANTYISSSKLVYYYGRWNVCIYIYMECNIRLFADDCFQNPIHTQRKYLEC